MKAGAPKLEALQHGEAGLTSVPPAEVEELLARLAAIAEKPTDVVDLYERQISRCKAPADRVRALARAAQVAASKGQHRSGASGFFELALSGTPPDDTLAVLEQAARDGDTQTGGERLRRALCRVDGGGRAGRPRRRQDARLADAARGLDGAPRPRRPRAGVHLARRCAHRPRGPAHARRPRGPRARGGRPAPRRGDALARPGRGVRRTARPAAPGAAREASPRAARRQDGRRRRPEEAARSVPHRSGRDGRAVGPAHRARRLPRHGAALRGPDPPRQGHDRARRAGTQGRPHVGGAARRSARGGRRLAPRAAHEAGRYRGDGRARAREVQHAQEAGAGRRARGLRATEDPGATLRRRAPSPRR